MSGSPVFHETESRDPGTLCVGEVEVRPGDWIQIESEPFPREVTRVFGKGSKTHAACKGTGVFPTGRIRWRVLASEETPASTNRPPKAGKARPRRASQGSLDFGESEQPLASALPALALPRDPPLWTLVGFDSAWTVANRGGLVAVEIREGALSLLEAPRAASFEEAAEKIATWRARGPVLIGLDQPLVVPNATGRRRADAAVSRVLACRGGGVQPANTSRLGMFDAEAPLWGFLRSLRPYSLDPRASPTDRQTAWVLEVFPALATVGLFPAIQRGRLLKYNPERTGTFRPEDWRRLALALSTIAAGLGLSDLARWAAETAAAKPTKALQDQIDAVLCLLVVLLRVGAPASTCGVGRVEEGCILTPATGELRSELLAAAQRDGTEVVAVA